MQITKKKRNSNNNNINETESNQTNACYLVEVWKHRIYNTIVFGLACDNVEFAKTAEAKESAI